MGEIIPAHLRPFWFYSFFYKYFHNYLAQQNYKDELQPAEKIVHLAVSVTNANGPHWPYIITMTTLYFTLSLLSQ